MSINIYHNGVELTNILEATPYKDTLDKELDQFNFTIKTDTIINFKKNDKITYERIVESGNSSQTIISKNFCIFNFLEKKDGLYYTYVLNMLSPTKLLENIVINGLAYTGLTSGNLMAQIGRVIEKLNAQEKIRVNYNSVDYPDRYGYACLISYSGNTDIANVGVSDFLWDSQMTAREILDDMASKGDSLIIGTDFEVTNGYITEISITTQKYEKTGTQIASANTIEEALEDVENIKGYAISFDSEYANGNLISLIKNSIPHTNIQTLYLPTRNDDLSVDDTADWHIITQEPIYSVNRVIMLAPIYVDNDYRFWIWENHTWNLKYRQGNVNDGLTTRCFYCPFDITSYIVEKDVFDSMSINEQKKHLYFIRGQKGIYGLYKRYKSGITGLFTNTAIENILSDIGIDNYVSNYRNSNNVVYWGSFDNPPLLCDAGTNNPIAPYQPTYNGYTIHISTSGDIENGAIYALSGDGGGVASLSTDNMKNSMFSVNYEPYADSVVVTEKTNITQNSKNMMVIKNQSDKLIDASKYYDSQQSMTERMGNREAEVNLLVDNLEDAYFTNPNIKNKLWNLGDYFMVNSVKWTCVAREIENVEGKLKARLTFSEGYNARNIAINESRDKRLYGIPLSKYVDRYIVVPFYNSDPYGSLSRYLDKRIFVKAWDDFTGGTTTQGWCLLDTINIGGSQRKDNVGGMLDNYAIAIEKTSYNSTKINIFLRYCNTDGKLENMDVVISDTNTANNLISNSSFGYDRLPFVNFVADASMGNANLITLNVKKDKMERIILVFRNYLPS